jgi:hypothetical protein
MHSRYLIASAVLFAANTMACDVGVQFCGESLSRVGDNNFSIDYQQALDQGQIVAAIGSGATSGGRKGTGGGSGGGRNGGSR